MLEVFIYAMFLSIVHGLLHLKQRGDMITNIEVLEKYEYNAT